MRLLLYSIFPVSGHLYLADLLPLRALSRHHQNYWRSYLGALVNVVSSRTWAVCQSGIA